MSASILTHYDGAFGLTKAGKPSKRWVSTWCAQYCPVATCERCGRYGSPVWVKAWWLRPRSAYRWNKIENYVPEPTLCMGCVNQLRPAWRQQDQLDENTRIINRIKKEVTRVKAENRRAA